MRMFVRPYNIDGQRLNSIIQGGTSINGIMLDAHITKLVPQMTKDVHEAAGSDAEFLIDPVTHKIDRPFYRKKRRSFQRLDYFYTYSLGTDAPSVQELSSKAQDGVDKMLMHQQYFNVSSLIAPYFYLNPKDCTSRTGSRFGAMKQWVRAFSAKTTGKPSILSLCFAAECLVRPENIVAIEQFVQEHKPTSVYLLLCDWEIDASEAATKGVLSFLERLQELGVSRIIWSHAPSWIYYLAPRGVTDFVSGFNYLSTLKQEFLDREEVIKGAIEHNYYIPTRFCKMTPPEARQAIEQGLIWPCECPACQGTVPDARNLIIEHYVHARANECERLGRSLRPVEQLRTWAEQTEEFLVKAQELDIKVIGNPNPSKWKSILPPTT